MDRLTVSQRNGQAQKHHNDDSSRCELQKPLYPMSVKGQGGKHDATSANVSRTAIHAARICRELPAENGQYVAFPRRVARVNFVPLRADKVERIT